MVDSVGKQNVNLSIKGSKAKLNTKNLNGTLITKDTPIFMKNMIKTEMVLLLMKKQRCCLPI